MNDVAVSYIFDTLTELKKLPFYKGQIKFRANNTESLMKEYNVTLEKSSHSMMEFIADVNDEMQGFIENDLKKLEYATRNVLQKHRVPNVDLMTKLTIAVTLIDATCHNTEYATHYDYGNIDVNYYSRRFRFLNLKKLNNAFMLLANMVEKENNRIGNYKVDLTQYKEIDNGFTIIINKLKDVHHIFKVLNNISK